MVEWAMAHDLDQISWMRPTTPVELVRIQKALGELSSGPSGPSSVPASVAGCFVAFQRGASGPGARGDPAWAAAAVVQEGRLAASAVVRGQAGAPYEAGLLFLRAGPLLEAAVRKLPERPDVLLVNGTGLDHPRRAGLALHLGALLGLRTVGVTHRPLCAQGAWPANQSGSQSPFLLDGHVVGFWLRTQRDARPLAVHAAWGTDPETAAAVVLATTGRARTPEPLRLARQVARAARALESSER